MSLQSLRRTEFFVAKSIALLLQCCAVDGSPFACDAQFANIRIAVVHSEQCNRVDRKGSTDGATTKANGRPDRPDRHPQCIDMESSIGDSSSSSGCIQNIIILIIIAYTYSHTT